MAEENQAEYEDEKVIQELKPSWKRFMGIIIFGGIMSFAAPPIIIVVLLYIWLKQKSEFYKITSERIIVTRGIISRRVEEIELYRIKDVAASQGILDRMLGIGKVKIISVDITSPVLILRGIAHPVEVKENLRKAFRASRKKEKVVSTEFLNRAS